MRCILITLLYASRRFQMYSLNWCVPIILSSIQLPYSPNSLTFFIISYILDHWNDSYLIQVIFDVEPVNVFNIKNINNLVLDSRPWVLTPLHCLVDFTLAGVIVIKDLHIYCNILWLDCLFKLFPGYLQHWERKQLVY